MHPTDKIKEILDSAKRVLIIQADNPDADSLASALALESIVQDMGKEPLLYCGIDMPEYLRYLPGWDRVNREIPSQFDASIIVDTSAMSLLEQLQNSGGQGWVASKPCIVLDHHAETANDIPFATISLVDHESVSTGELIYNLAKSFNWPLPLDACEFIMTSILGDSMGLTTENTRAETYRIMAELVDAGVSRPRLEELRREYNKMQPVIFRYKADLIDRTEVFDDKLALVIVPQQEINDFSPLYNPAPLIQGDHLQTKGILISVVLKSYDSGRVTAAIRCNQGAPIAAKLAESFGGGGHNYAAGFKLEGKRVEDVKNEVTSKVRELLS